MDIVRYGPMSTQHSTSPDKEVSPSGTEVDQTDSADTYSPAPRVGLGYALAEIDPETLPEDNPWPEVHRRLVAYRKGVDGWRTGTVETTIDEWESGGQ